MTNFHQVTEDEEWVYPVMEKPYLMGCCDCGLVHNVQFQIVRVPDETKGFDNDEVINDPQLKVRINVTRNNRSTAAMRREDKKRKERKYINNEK